MGNTTNEDDKLLRNGEVVSPVVESLRQSCKFGHLNTVQKWLKDNAKGLKRVSPTGPLVPIRVATKAKNDDSKNGLHKSLLDVVSQASLTACYFGHCKVLLEFLLRGSNPRVRDKRTGRSLLHVACQSGNTKMVRFLLDPRVRDKFYIERQKDVESRIRRAVMVSKINWDVNLLDNFDRTPLMLAAWNGHQAIVKLLLEAEADVHLADKRFGWNALIGATHFQHISTVKTLLSTPHYHEPIEYTPRTLRKRAFFKVEEKTAAELCDWINYQSEKSGTTALIEASRLGYNDILQVLVYAGAKLCTKNKLGNTCLHEATENCHDEVVRFLIKHLERVGIASSQHRIVKATTASKLGSAPMNIQTKDSRPLIKELVKFGRMGMSATALIRHPNNDRRETLAVARELHYANFRAYSSRDYT